MRIIICAVFLNGLILAAPLLRAQDVQILMTGEFAGSYVTAQSGETWYGIYNDDNQFRLVRTKINVEAIHDDMVIEKEGEKTGKKVSTEQSGNPLFLVRGIEGLEERVVGAVFQGKKFIFPGEMLRLGEGNSSITVIAFGDIQKPEPRWSPCYLNYTIQFREGIHPEYHLLAEYPKLAAFDEIPYLIWAGDLDNDGKLDMFWDLTGHYAVRQYTPFLSSLAKAGEVVAKAAEFKNIID